MPAKILKPPSKKSGQYARGNPGQRRVSSTKRAGLVFSVPRFRRRLREATYYTLRAGVGGAVYVSAVVEYLIAEILELGGYAAKDTHKKRITPRHLVLAIRNDEEGLGRLISPRMITIPAGGVVEHIEDAMFVHPRNVKAVNRRKQLSEPLVRERSEDAMTEVETSTERSTSIASCIVPSARHRY